MQIKVIFTREPLDQTFVWQVRAFLTSQKVCSLPSLLSATSLEAASCLAVTQACTAPVIQTCWVYLGLTECQNTAAKVMFDLVEMGLAETSELSVVFSAHPN